MADLLLVSYPDESGSPIRWATLIRARKQMGVC
jgi:hypothetical protein